MALELSAKGDRVFYLNTYAGPQLMKAVFGYGSGEGDVGRDARPTRGESITFMDLPTGEWKAKDLAEWVEGKEVLIINSFEFAAMTRALKDRVATDLLTLQKKTGITVILFSHSLQKDLEPGCIARGAIGLLTARALAVSRVGEQSARAGGASPTGPAVPIAPEYAVKGKVNEKRMLNAYLLPKKFGGHRPDPTVDIRPDTGFSYHYADFWCNPFDRGPTADYTGRAMSLLARTPLLQKYLLDHPDTTFMQGNTPSEARLAAEMTLG